MSDFWLKYALRVAHIGSLIGICHKTILDYSAGTISNDNALLYGLFGIVAMVSGFANTFVLQPKKMGDKRKLWVGFHHLKLLLTLILYTPLGKIFGQSALIDLRMWWMMAIIFVSPYMRFYRQKYATDRPQI